jgi:DNA-binding NarL/FixJ family response regulator
MNLCLSTEIKHLGRWSQAFPDGKIINSLEPLPASGAVNLLWLHAFPSPTNRIDELIQEARKKLPEVYIVVISNTPSHQETLLALHNGAVGYCHAQATPRLLQQVATVVTNGGLWIGTELMGRILAGTGQILTCDPGHPALAQLTPREQEVALAVGRGISNKEVAHQLSISDRTVKAHLSAIFEKLEVRDRLQLVILLGRGGEPEADNHSPAPSVQT